MKAANNQRIAILDGFRAIAILAVVFYHYFDRWNDPKFPYLFGNYFHHGAKGVPFFFMISGFVICYTLENTTSFKIFWKKRFIRLFPSMFIASVITFVFLLLFDHNNMFEDSNHFRNLMISLTFLPPNLFDWILGTRCYFSNINGDYWSLWPEVQFYFFSSSIYFLDKVNFKRNFIAIGFLLLLIYIVILYFNFNQIKIIEKIINLFNLLKYLSHFLAGAVFYLLYQKKEDSKFEFVLLFLLFLSVNLSGTLVSLSSSLIMYSLFFCFVYFPRALFFLENKVLLNIGVSSYFLYLIHDYLGVVWIRNFVALFYPYSFIAPIIMIFIMIKGSVFYTLKVEPKITLRLKNILFKK